MSEHTAIIRWTRESETFSVKTYNRSHEWDFENGQTVKASSAPEYLGDKEMVDPEQAFTASISSCHMLTFLAIAAKSGYTIDRYEDRATGILGKNTEDKLAMTEVILKPAITFTGDKAPTEEQLSKLHEKAHMYCFIANSVNTKVTVNKPE